jgi:hydroxylamine dehydrogenase
MEATAARVAAQLVDVGFKKVFVLKGGYNEWVAAQYPIEKKWTIKQECVTCHAEVTPSIVADWKQSKHSKFEVSCSVCHGEGHMTAEDVPKSIPVKPDRCALCHPVRADQFKKSKHALAWSSMKAMPTAHWQPMAMVEGMKGCGGCHRVGLKSEAEIKELREDGVGFGYASCDVCHTRHTFSVKEATQPQACQTCHMGLDHAQWEMYSSSKHGVRYLLKQNGTLPETTPAPTCQTCHMQEANHAVKTGWGFYAVRLPLPQDKKQAEASKTVLQALGFLDPEGKPTARMNLAKKEDMIRFTQEEWTDERVTMLKACNSCHTLSFAKGELEKGDQIVRATDAVMAEAIQIVADLYKDGILKKPKNYAYAFPDFLTLQDAPTMIELKLWRMYSEYRMRAFQGAFHASPVYAFWYGWSGMQTSLLEIKSMAEEMRRKSK